MLVPIAASADAVVVGSALIAEMDEKARSGEALPEIQIHDAAVQLLQKYACGCGLFTFLAKHYPRILCRFPRWRVQ